MRSPAAPALALASGAIALAACRSTSSAVTSSLRLPYRDAGLDERQAAAFLLDRLAFGPTPESTDRVVQMGVENWVEQQLQGQIPDPDLDARERTWQDYDQPLAWLAEHYRRAGGISKEAQEAGYIPADAIKNTPAYREGTERYMAERNIRIYRDLEPVLVESKIQRAVRAKNQLREVMADFWFNHFNVTARRGNVQATLVYDRDAIRPNVLAPFRQILGATARHPRMLQYLNNEASRAKEGTRTLNGRAGRGGGINENYGRELMELHTLGVDGGYTQQDVQEVARAFTGWTVFPYNNLKRKQTTEQQLRRLPGAIREGEFLFRPDWHDADTKSILGRTFPAGRGIEEGETVLDLVAAHPNTARHIARKLAIRFIADDPSDAAIDTLAAAFSASGGDTRAVLRALVESPIFWNAATGADGQPTKVKTPFELVISAVRATGGEVEHVRSLSRALEQMGEPIYYREPPTGFPDHAAAWINPGLLLNRMSFGLRLASGGMRGVRVDLDRLTGGRQPATAPEALHVYGALLLPGRDLGPTTDVLEELVAAQDVASRVDAAAQAAAPSGPGEGVEDAASGEMQTDDMAAMDDDDAMMTPEADEPTGAPVNPDDIVIPPAALPRQPGESQRDARQRIRTQQAARREAVARRRAAKAAQAGGASSAAAAAPTPARGDDPPRASSAATVVGVLLGSPAFQRQ